MRSLAIGACVALAGCGTLDLRSDSGHAFDVDYRFGFTRVLRNAIEQPQFVTDTTLGVWVGGDNGGVGWREMRVAVAPSGCQIIFVADTPEQLAAAQHVVSLLKSDGESACAQQQ